jgi:hypothetical protein
VLEVRALPSALLKVEQVFGSLILGSPLTFVSTHDEKLQHGSGTFFAQMDKLMTTMLRLKENTDSEVSLFLWKRLGGVLSLWAGRELSQGHP